MEILQLNEYFKLHLGDSQKILKLYPDNYFDSVVCDPPYHLTSIVKRFGKPGSAPAQFGKDGAFSRASRGFMGKEWDGGDIAFRPEFWAEVYRVLKPGGHLLAFSGSRTYHRMAVGIEDAGFEIRDQIMWLYSGFPKSHDVSKGIDKAAGAVREVVGHSENGIAGGTGEFTSGNAKSAGFKREYDITAHATDAARQWQGWGSALKPAHEPIVVARKPLIGTIAENVLTYGTGALNIDGCRVPMDGEVLTMTRPAANQKVDKAAPQMNRSNKPFEYRNDIGRWPANIIHDGSEEVTMPLGEPSRFFKQCNLEDTEWLAQNLNLYNAETAAENLCLQNVAGSIVQSVAVTSALPAGVRVSEWKAPSMSVTVKESRMLGEAVITAMQSIGQKCLQEWRQERLSPLCSHVSVVAQREPTGTMTITASLLKSDGSVASITFNIMPMNLEAGAKVCEPSCGSKFIYCAKASKKDRDEGLDGFEEKSSTVNLRQAGGLKPAGDYKVRNIHPTVKPTDLMRYLCRLVTPPNGVVLDPFMGSGSTGKAAMLEGFRFVGIDMTEEYIGIAKARIQKAFDDSNDLLSYRGRKT